MKGLEFSLPVKEVLIVDGRRLRENYLDSII
jgi:hypothetical protein